MISDIVNKYTATVTNEHRKKFGQFFTESRVAEFMAAWVTAKAPASLYDPAFGLGAFYYAAKSHGFSGTIHGTELDTEILFSFKAVENSNSCFIDNADYLSVWGNSYDAIICNPPYMRFQEFNGKERIMPDFERKTGIKLSGYTNIASAFLLKSIYELSAEGRLAYIMPLEFLNTGYGALVKRYLIEQGSITIIKIECEKEVFPDVTTSVGIILFEKKNLTSLLSSL